jgi:hypothetical protein
MDSIQETPIDNMLVEPTEQIEPDKVMESLVDAPLISSIEQPVSRGSIYQILLLISLDVLLNELIFKLNNQLRYNLY